MTGLEMYRGGQARQASALRLVAGKEEAVVILGAEVESQALENALRSNILSATKVDQKLKLCTVVVVAKTTNGSGDEQRRSFLRCLFGESQEDRAGAFV